MRSESSRSGSGSKSLPEETGADSRTARRTGAAARRDLAATKGLLGAATARGATAATVKADMVRRNSCVGAVARGGCEAAGRSAARGGVGIA